MRLIIQGPPGSGKGTQAKLLCKRLGLVHFATGDILRDAVRLGTPLGLQAKSFMDQGRYVPDDLVNDLVAERLGADERSKDFVLDGYPRTLAQAVALDAVIQQRALPLDAVLFMNVADDEIVRRNTGRRFCPADATTFHIVYRPPRTAGICDICGGPLQQRIDDDEATVRDRLRLFHATMPEVTRHYRQQGLVREVPGEGSIQDIHNRILQLLP